ncbi:hypothetical protein VD659_08095 [Herbiconiux sp. 11R-BC]|uniref:hypothetical protein n=1 Tax=Herbiconiux sp. 11R-BC TaxID=3111637 RepID=UPI003BFE339B
MKSSAALYARIAQTVGAIVVVGGFLTIAFFRELDHANGDSAAAWRAIGTIALVCVPLMAIVLVFGVLLTGGLVRPHNLRKDPAIQLVKESYTTNSSRLILAQFLDPAAGAPEKRQPPRWMSITISEEGVGFWSGSSEPTEVLTIPWDRVSRPDSIDVIERGRWCRGISLDVLTLDGRLYKLELPVLGRGPFGLLSARESDIENMATAVRSHLHDARA